jgi:uncharacterized protein (DUF1330 family)
MAYYGLLQYTVADQETQREYGAAVAPILAQYGVKILAVTGPGMSEAKVYEGTPRHAVTVIAEFESEAAFDRWYRSPDYRRIIHLRTDSTDGWLVGLPAIQSPAR